MATSNLRLEHINLPARDPVGLAAWYATTFGFTADAHRVRGDGVLFAFQRGDPVARPSDVHIGLRAPSRAALAEWATKFGAEVHAGEEFATFRVSDPEGNCVELYAPVSA